MPPRKVAVDYPYSFARRSGSDLRVVLELVPSAGSAGVSLDGEPPIIRFRRNGRTVRATASASQHGERLRLDATIPWSKLGPGMWRLAMRPSPESDVQPLRGRLLVSRNRPLALLPGGAPRTRLEPPRSAAGRSPVRRAFDAAASRLPERQQQRLRSAAGSAYRRVRG